MTEEAPNQSPDPTRFARGFILNDRRKKMKNTKPRRSEKFMAWSFIICAFAWMAVPPAGFAIGFMFLTLGLIYLRSVSRREREWREEPIQAAETTRGK